MYVREITTIYIYIATGTRQNRVFCEQLHFFEAKQNCCKIVAELNLYAYTGPPRFLRSPPDQVTGFLTKETKLQCDVIGHPTPEVKWTRSPQAPLPLGRTEVTKNSISIKDTKSGDGGSYICTVMSKYGMIIHRTFLKVKTLGK